MTDLKPAKDIRQAMLDSKNNQEFNKIIDKIAKGIDFNALAGMNALFYENEKLYKHPSDTVSQLVFRKLREMGYKAEPKLEQKQDYDDLSKFNDCFGILINW